MKNKYMGKPMTQKSAYILHNDRLFLTVPQTDYIIVHWFIFVFDLTVAVWMMLARTRPIAMVFCALFHLMNSRLFTIGMFPWVCLATMPLFYSFDWPKQVLLKFEVVLHILSEATSKKMNNATLCESNREINDDKQLNDSTSGLNNDKNSEDYEGASKKPTDEFDYNTIKDGLTNSDLNESNAEVTEEINNVQHSDKKDQIKYKTANEKRTTYIILFYVFIQGFLPYSHFITKGYNNWTDGLYGYSWDMMVHTWDVQSVVVKIVDNNNHKELYVDPYIYTLNDRWSRHGDMVYQYAKCLKEKLLMEFKHQSNRLLSENISIYIDVWCSMNGRFTQRMFDPNSDILKVNWSPFQRIPYLLPLLDESLAWRQRLDAIRKNVYSWNNYSDVIFFADFPGYYQEKYIPEELYNVTLTVLEGTVIFEPEVTNFLIGQSYQLTNEDYVHVKAGNFHKVINIGKSPAFYMYTFMNSTEIKKTQEAKPKLPIFKELRRRFNGMITFCNLLCDNFMQLLYKSPNKCT
ncbi:hypothetical protein O3G_MSEX013604 [Manduca sexta]|uniref:Vitamin K-dependent gamma-carboxylase n=1 Tax=Manduca sexta TaxID=7130 RepID=A0A921ZSG9_MANSE|nr:hypothetical protein O3G_MSEX013604 [Manduca sexta]